MPKHDVTSFLASFREAARHLWNCHYLPQRVAGNEWDVRDSFDLVIQQLFSSLVVEPLKIGGALAPANSHQPQVIDGLLICPSSESGVPILINRDNPRSGYWDHPKRFIAPQEAELRVARFFDFDQVGYRDFQYLEVLIVASADESEIVGRWALLEFMHARFFAEQAVI